MSKFDMSDAQLAKACSILREAVTARMERASTKNERQLRRLLMEVIDALTELEIPLVGCDVNHADRWRMGMAACYKCLVKNPASPPDP